MSIQQNVTSQVDRLAAPYMSNIQDNKQSYDTGHVVTHIPVQRYAANAAEEKIAAMREIHDQAPTGFFEGMDIKELLPYFQTRVKEDEDLRFEEFVMKTIDPSNAYEIDWALNNFSSIWDKYDQEIESNAQLLEHVCLLLLRGVQTPQDIYLVYLIGTGKINVDLNAVVKLLEIDEASIQQARQARAQGYLNSYDKRRLTEKPGDIKVLNFAQPFTIVMDNNGKKSITLNYKEDKPTNTVSRNESFVKRFADSLSTIL